MVDLRPLSLPVLNWPYEPAVGRRSFGVRAGGKTSADVYFAPERRGDYGGRGLAAISMSTDGRQTGSLILISGLPVIRPELALLRYGLHVHVIRRIIPSQFRRAF